MILNESPVKQQPPICHSSLYTGGAGAHVPETLRTFSKVAIFIFVLARMSCFPAVTFLGRPFTLVLFLVLAFICRLKKASADGMDLSSRYFLTRCSHYAWADRRRSATHVVLLRHSTGRVLFLYDRFCFEKSCVVTIGSVRFVRNDSVALRDFHNRCQGPRQCDNWGATSNLERCWL